MWIMMMHILLMMVQHIWVWHLLVYETVFGVLLVEMMMTHIEDGVAGVWSYYCGPGVDMAVWRVKAGN